MDDDFRIISRIISGLLIFYHKSKKFCLIYPSTRLKYEAELYYQSIYDDHKYSDWLTIETALSSLKEMGVWTIRYEKELADLDKQIETAKIDLFKTLVQPNKQKHIRSRLKGLKKSKDKYLQIKHSLDNMTLEGYCENLKNQFLIIHSLHYLDNMENMTKVFLDNDNIDFAELEDLASVVTQHNIDVSTFRRLARNDIWKNYWSANKDRIFAQASVDWTDEQRALVLFTRMYDSARESMECPPDAVFEDDDMFDGWMALQHEKSTQDKQEKLEEKSLGQKMAKSQEMFFFAGEASDAKEIYKMNSSTSMATIQERNAAIFKNKEIDAAKLPDTARELNQRSNELLKNKFRKN